jgi:hypothetical protein
MKSGSILARYRVVLGIFIVGLMLSGVTAFPLLLELRLLCEILGVGNAPSAAGHSGMEFWILTVRWGLEDAYSRYPWIAYGTDWLAFAHIVLAIFFLGPFVNPVRNVWVLWAGLIACALVVLLAMVCGPLRGIPLAWRLIDSSFGVFGAIPLLYCIRLTRMLSAGEKRGIIDA